MKFLSSIFSFDTVDFKVSKLLSLTVLYVTAGYLVIEITVRSLIPDGQYPKGHWWNNELRVKTSQLEKLENVDIMFTGSSLCASNIPPQYFDSEMKKNGVNSISFNAGIRGSDFEGIADGFKKLFWERKHSKYVVLVISPFDLNEWNLFVRDRTQSFMETLQNPLYETVLIDCFSQASWFFGFRNEIREFIIRREWLYDEAYNGIRGYSPLHGQRTKVTDLELKIDRDGIIAESLFDFVNWLLKRNIKVIIADAIMYPLERKRLDPGELEKFYEILKEVAEINDVRYLNTNGVVPDNKYFIDSGHLNLEGGKIYARNLANSLLESGFPY
jgi:hypothetical protein